MSSAWIWIREPSSCCARCAHEATFPVWPTGKALVRIQVDRDHVHFEYLSVDADGKDMPMFQIVYTRKK